jgi:uncharacterized protein (TIGR03083 family)
MGPWPLVTGLVREELKAYLDAARVPGVERLLTRCPPWTVRDLTAHLALTFRRFAEMLEKSRRGDFSPPFAPEELSAHNLRAVERFRGDPATALALDADRFLKAVREPDELMAHQFGPIPVSLQVLFGLNEVVIHHDDLAEARGSSYQPDDRVVEVLIPVHERVLGGLPSAENSWTAILANTGRFPVEPPEE